MSKGKVFSLLVTSMALSGCVPVMSLHPLYQPTDIVFQQDLLGEWTEDVNKPDTIWRFERIESTDGLLIEDGLKEVLPKLYKLTLCESDGNPRGLLVGGLIQLDGMLYLDLYPAQFPSGEPNVEHMKLMYNAFFFEPAHTFLRLDSTEKRLVLYLTDDDSFKKLIQAHEEVVRHTVIDGRPVLTASTAELQVFVRAYAKSEHLFSKTTELTRIEKPATSSSR